MKGITCKNKLSQRGCRQKVFVWVWSESVMGGEVIPVQTVKGPHWEDTMDGIGGFVIGIPHECREGFPIFRLWHICFAGVPE